MKNEELHARQDNRPETAPETPENGTPTPGPIVATNCARLNVVQLRLFLTKAARVTDPATLAGLLEDLTRQTAGAVHTRITDRGRYINTSDTARILEAIRSELATGSDPTSGKRWADLFPGVLERLNDATRIDGPNIYARVLARFAAVEGNTPAAPGETLQYIETRRTRPELTAIFSRLVEAGFIDGAAPESLADFLNTFDREATKQGRISWIWKDKRTDKIAARHILDFVAQIAARPIFDTITPELYKSIAPAVFGVTIGRDIVSRFRAGWLAGRYCETHQQICTIIAGQ